MSIKISLIAAVSDNGVIGSGLDIPWKAKHNQWLLVGRKTFDSMGKLPDRKYAVVSRSRTLSNEDDCQFYTSVEEALEGLTEQTDHVFVSGGGEIYKAVLPFVSTMHLSRVHKQVEGDVYFPELATYFRKVFEQSFFSNINYTYQIWQKNWN